MTSIQAKRDSLMNKFFKFNKWIFIILLIVLVCSVFLIPQYVKPQEVNAIALVDDAAFWIVAGILVAIICGLIYYQESAVRDTGKTVYNSSSADTQAEIRSMAEEGKINGQYDVPDSVYNEIKSWGEANLDTDSPPMVNFDVYNTGLKAPWADNTLFLYDYVLDITQPRIISTAAYEEAFAVSQDTLVWTDSGKYMDYRYYSHAGNQDVYVLYINGVRASSQPYGANAYTYAYFINLADSVQWNYSINADSLGALTNTPAPRFVLVANQTSGLVTPAIVYQYSDGNYYLRPFVCTIASSAFYPGTALDHDIEQKDIDAAYNPNVAVPDWVIDGHRYVPYTDEFGNVIGLYPEELLSGEWATGIEAGIGTVAGDLELIDTRLAGWEVWLAKMNYLDQLNSLTFDETGKLEVTMETTAPYELDIPETEFDLPMLQLLADRFPFSIPFDLYYAIANLAATPAAPDFDINFPASIFGADATMSLDFSIFENLAVVVRWIILLGFVIGLIILTRKLIRG